jgi:hypothetical protein
MLQDCRTCYADQCDCLCQICRLTSRLNDLIVERRKMTNHGREYIDISTRIHATMDAINAATTL